jgi:hypothetical protein
MLTADFGNGQSISGDGAVQGLISGLKADHSGLAGSAQVQELQVALQAYGQSAGDPTAASVTPTGQMDVTTLMALGGLAAPLKKRVGRQVPDRVWEMLVQLRGNPATVASDMLNQRITTYAGLLADAVRALTYARYTGGALTPPIPRPVINPLSGAGDPFYKQTWFWVVLGGLGIAGAAWFMLRGKK